MQTPRNVCYFYSNNISSFNYGSDHPMKPKRISLTHDLIVTYDLYTDLNVYKPHLASSQEMGLFHDSEYLKYLEYLEYYYRKTEGKVDSISQLERENIKKYIEDNEKKAIFKIGQTTDCPSFAGLFEFNQISTGGSWDCAILLGEGNADICINYAGGYHHAKKMEASGFCYVNDIVISILCLLRLNSFYNQKLVLRYFQRVLYVDIDVHHGDGVEEAFYLTNRVLTLSFHQYGDDFFPGSGSLESCGFGEGKYHSINVPLKPGMNDETYPPLFKNILTNVITRFQPNAIVAQTGADSIAYDKLGNFNMSSYGHGECIRVLESFGIPCILVGGGGYTIENVPRCWVNETAISLGIHDLPNEIPTTAKAYDLYKPDHKLFVSAKNSTENKNSPDDLTRIQAKIDQYLKDIESAPGIPFHYIPDVYKMEKIFDNENQIISDDQEEKFKDSLQFNSLARKRDYKVKL